MQRGAGMSRGYTVAASFYRRLEHCWVSLPTCFRKLRLDAWRPSLALTYEFPEFKRVGPLWSRDPYFQLLLADHGVRIALKPRQKLIYLRLGTNSVLGKAYPDIADYVLFDWYVELWLRHPLPGMWFPQMVQIVFWRTRGL